jgi:hypothetical protein
MPLAWNWLAIGRQHPLTFFDIIVICRQLHHSSAYANLLTGYTDYPHYYANQSLITRYQNRDSNEKAFGRIPNGNVILNMVYMGIYYIIIVSVFPALSLLASFILF